MNWVKLLVAIVVCQLAGIIGSIFTISSIPVWYAFLNKPFFNPPNWLFGPAWIVLYTLMGISLYLVWQKGLNEKTKVPLAFFGVQLVLNTLWSIIFFGFQAPMLAFFEIILLWFAIVFTSYKFYPVSKKAAYLLIPYIVWVSFATLLNYSIWVLN